MGRTLFQFLRLSMVAVIFATSSLSGALACGEADLLGSIHAPAGSSVHDHGTSGRHSAYDHAAYDGGTNERVGEDHHAIAAESMPDRSAWDRQGPAGLTDCDGCPHMHVHCCAWLAIPADDGSLKLGYAAGVPVLEAGAPLLLGQLFYPLLRPPSATA